MEGQILEEFMLEAEIEFQVIDKCRIIELQNEQEIEECIASETIEKPDFPLRIIEEQEIEESIKEEGSDIILPEMYRTEKVYIEMK